MDILALSEDDAKLFIEIVDKVLPIEHSLASTHWFSFWMLRHSELHDWNPNFVPSRLAFSGDCVGG